jgi:HlyD family secretion protein
MRGTWFRILGLLVFVAALAGVGGWWLMRGQGGATPAVKATATANTTAGQPPPNTRPARGDVLTLPGVIEPFEAIPVSANLTAAISRLLVRDGSGVSKGQLLCVLDDVELRRQIDSARLVCLQAEETLRSARQRRATEQESKRLSLTRAQRDFEDYRAESALQLQTAETAGARAQRELTEAEALYQAKAVSAEDVRAKREALEDAERALELTKTSTAAGLASREKALAQVQLEAQDESISEQEIQAYQMGVNNSREELADRQRRLADTQVLAPIGGTVRIIPRTRTSAMTPTGQSAEVLGPGVRVFEGDPFLEIATTEQACMRVEVDETDVARLRLGLPAKITGDAFPGRELKGEVITIQTSGRKAGEGVSLFPVTVLITSPLQGVRMGMTGDVTIDLSKAAQSTEKGERQ